MLVSIFTLVCANVKVSAAGEEWHLVTDASTLQAGDELIIVANNTSKGVFVAGDITSQYLKSITASVSSDKKTMSNIGNAVILTLGGSKDQWTLSNSAGKQLGATAEKKLAWGSGKTTWKISISSDNATIQSTTSSYGRFLYNVNNPRFTIYTSNTNVSMVLPQLYKKVVTDHVCSSYIEESTPQAANLYSSATCTESAKYYMVCSECNSPTDKTKIYSYGEPNRHKADELGICTVCNQMEGTYTASQSVRLLFEKYYNHGYYTKDSVLNVNEAAIDEIKTYFHASASIRYRRTVYTPNALEMVTSVDGVSYSNSISRYEDKDGKVYHTGLGDDYYVNWSSVEDKFVTLDDFINDNSIYWTYSNGVYTHNLSSPTFVDGDDVEDDMTRMAREFVAPMWLAPDKYNCNYHKFTKLTVEVINEALVIKLYVDGLNSGILVDGANDVFSQVSIIPMAVSLNPDELTENTYTYTFSTQQYYKLGTVTLDNVKWTLEGTVTYFGIDSNSTKKGQQFGSGNNPAKNFTLSSDVFTNVSQIIINTSGANDINGTLTVYVGGTVVDSIKLTNTATDYVFDVNNLSGSIVLSYSQTSSKAIYIKTITIVYFE